MKQILYLYHCSFTKFSRRTQTCKPLHPAYESLKLCKLIFIIVSSSCSMSTWLECVHVLCQPGWSVFMFYVNLVGVCSCSMSTWLECVHVLCQPGWSVFMFYVNLVGVCSCSMSTWLECVHVLCQLGLSVFMFYVNLVGVCSCSMSTWLECVPKLFNYSLLGDTIVLYC